MSASAVDASFLALPDIEAPVFFRKRAYLISKMTGKVCVSATAGNNGNNYSLGISLAAALSRPFLLVTQDLVIFILAFYQAIVFATLCLAFAAFSKVFIELRE